MLDTDLSQLSDVEVVGTDRLLQILTDLQRQEDRTVSFETVKEIAKRAGADTVLLGSFVKSGETIRINTKLQEASSGRILDVERADATGDANLFPAVDELTRRIRGKLARAKTGGRDDRALNAVTTTSVDAYRTYTEGLALQERHRDSDAGPLFEKAVAADPTFALALAKLAGVADALGDGEKAEEYARRAFDNRDRLTARDRSYVE